MTLESIQLEIDQLKATHFRADCSLCRDLPCTAEDRHAVERRDQRLQALRFQRDAWLFERSSMGDQR